MSSIVYIEGPKGSGKSTLTKALADRLTKEGHTVKCLQEPGGSDNSPMAKAIRELLKSDVPRTDDCTFLLMQAARIEQFKTEIEPHLDTNTIFLIDRSIYSSVVTQFYINGVDYVTDVHRLSAVGFSADLTLWLLPPKQEVKRRKAERNANYDIINPESKVNQEYATYTAVADLVQAPGMIDPAFSKSHLTIEDKDSLIIERKAYIAIINLLRKNDVSI